MASGTGPGSGPASGSDNPFIRFKRQVDERISNGIRAAWALSSSSRAPASGPPAAAADTVPQAQPHPQIAALEASVADGLRQQTVYSWLGHSPYSPLRLQSLRPPVPRDAPVETSDQYSFRDAFEDLLVVSAGQPLPALPWRRPGPDLHPLLGPSWSRTIPALLAPPLAPLRNGEFADFADGVSPVAWAAQLERRGLWTSYFPAQTFAAEASRIVRQVTSEPMRAELDPAEAERHVQFLIQESSMRDEEKADRFGPLDGRGLLFHLAALAPTLVWGGEHSPPQGEAWEKPASDSASAQEPSQEAETSEDLFLNLRSDFATSSGGRQSPADNTLVPAAYQKEAIRQPSGKAEDYEATETMENPDGSKTVKTIERRVSPNSNKETTTTVQYDADGNVVHRSTVKHYAGGWSFGGQLPGGQHSEDDGTRSAHPDKDKKQSGWFWTR